MRLMIFASDMAWRGGAAGIAGFASILILGSLLAASVVEGPPSSGEVPAERESAEDVPESPAPDAPAEQGVESDADDDEAESEPARVIVRAGRNEEAVGHLKLEDDSVIVVETLRGEIKSFPAMRVLDVIYLVDPEPDQRGIVLMRDGQSREGVIIEDAFEHVIMEVEGIRTRLPREAVDRVILKPTFQQQYEQFVSTLDPNLPRRTILMCRWLVDQRRYDLAKMHLEELLAEADDPKNLPEANRMLRVVEAQLALQADEASQDPVDKGEDGPQSVPEDDDSVSMEEFPGGLLSRDEVNLIRVYEIDFENPPRMSVRPEVIRKLVSDYSTHPSIPSSQSERTELFRADPSEVVRLMFEVRARDLYDEVQVHTEPESMNIFRRRVHDNWLLNNCGSCHSGQDAGRFFLHRRGYKDERVRYTNFLILERLELDSQWPLINYSEPEMSLIIQHGLPRDEARLPHPDVSGWQPVFTRSRERLKRESIRWIESMMQPRPTYPVDYEPPLRERPGQSAEAAAEGRQER